MWLLDIIPILPHKSKPTLIAIKLIRNLVLSDVNYIVLETMQFSNDDVLS